MSDARDTLYRLAAEQGWDGASMLALCLNYIDAQESNDAFEDFLQQHAELENNYPSNQTIADMEWDAAMVGGYDDDDLV